MEGQLKIILFTTLTVLFLASSSTADNQGLDPYPTTNCFKDILLSKKKLPSKINGVAQCSNHHPDKESFCFKMCILRWNDIIKTTETPQFNDSSASEETISRNYENILEYTFTIDPSIIMTGLLLYYHDVNVSSLEIEFEKDPKAVETEIEMAKRFEKCEITSIVIPKKEHPCSQFTPETRGKMEKMKDCIEEFLVRRLNMPAIKSSMSMSMSNSIGLTSSDSN